MILTLVSFLGLLACGCQAVLQVSISLSKVELSVGESKFFTCTALGEPVSVDWFSPQGERMVPSQRVLLHREGVRSRLTLYSVNVEDAGIYRCLATTASGLSQEATVVLEIYQKLTFRNVPSPQEFRQGEEAQVVCDVISSPVPIVSWFYKEQEITPEFSDRLQVVPGNGLRILGLEKRDEGLYRCEARVEARGEIDFRDISVIVNVPPVISVPQQSFNATADYQESVTFTCRAYGSPEPEVTWKRRGQQVDQSERYVLKPLGSSLTVRGSSLMVRGSSLTVRGSSLTLRGITQGDGGPYICVAQNKAGVAQQELFLKVFVQPSITVLVNVTVVEGGVAVLSCSAEGDPLPGLTWRRASDGLSFREGDKSADGRVQVHGHHGKSTLSISAVRLQDRGRFDCEALSRIGGHQKSMYLDIEYVPVFVSTHTRFFSWEGNAVNLSCAVQAHPPAVLLWQRDRLTVGTTTEGPGNARVYSAEGRSLLEVTPLSDGDFGQYSCTARNSIGARVQQFILAQADVPSSPSSLRSSSVSQRSAMVTFTPPESHGGVPVTGYLVRYRSTSAPHWTETSSHGLQTMVPLSGLDPNSTYEVRVAAFNGRGPGEFSRTETFHTLPIREPSPPLVRGQREAGQAYRLGVFKQDDGGLPILEYIVKYRLEQEQGWVTRLVSGQQDSVQLQPLQWSARYEVQISARNTQGLSEPAYYSFNTPQRPHVTDSVLNDLGLGVVVALGVCVVVLVLLGLDLSCCFLRRSGLLMCVTRRLCGRKSAPCSKGKELEEGKAAYLKLPLKEENGREALSTEAVEEMQGGVEHLEDRCA
ncbi:neural cell adhesion molecule 2-like [Conger conger]|uniref:neural cell adhesion molecule 2-like n=1 Tax=Conger conger TaxID=82655 RepID=UPI002A5A361C|nr:neural cell adhesion molecule 2-like [Conger conger]